MTTPSNARLTWAGALTLVSLLTLPVGLIDPLEGFPALIVGLVTLILARNISGVKLAKMALIPLIFAIVLMAIMLTVAFIAQNPAAVMDVTPTTDNWLALTVFVLLWPQRLAVALLVVGIVIYAARIFRTRKPVAEKTSKPTKAKKQI